MEDVTRRALEWLFGRDTGLSSLAICSHMLGVDQVEERDWNYPRDPGDLGRCLRLLELIPEWKPRIREMAAYGPRWSALVSEWDNLAATMSAEVGIDWSKGQSAPITYGRMKVLINRVA